LRRRELRQRLRDDVAEQIGEAGEGQLDLRSAGTRREDAEPARRRPVDALLPKTGFADARLAL
jgi:hypothetical protein